MRRLLLAVAICALACRQRVAQVQPTAEPTARIVYVVVTATPAPQKEDAVLAAALREQEMASYSATHAPATPRGYSVPAAPMAVAPVTAEPVPYCVIQDFVTRLPDSDGDVWFAGEVVNLGPRPAKVQILVKAYTINERLLDSKTVYPRPDPIPPGGRSHFESFARANGDTIRKVIPEVLPR